MRNSTSIGGRWKSGKSTRASSIHDDKTGRPQENLATSVRPPLRGSDRSAATKKWWRRPRPTASRTRARRSSARRKPSTPTSVASVRSVVRATAVAFVPCVCIQSFSQPVHVWSSRVSVCELLLIVGFVFCFYFFYIGIFALKPPVFPPNLLAPGVV